MARTIANKSSDKHPCETSPVSTDSAQGAHGMVTIRDYAEYNSEPVTPASQAVRRKGMKAILLFFGLSGVAALGGGAVINREATEVVSRVIVQKVEDVSGPVKQKIEDVSRIVMQKVEDVSGSVMQKVEDVSGSMMQKVENVSGDVMQKLEDVSRTVMPKIEDVSGVVVQKASAALDGWQEQPVQATAELSGAIVPAPDVPSAALVERSVVPVDMPTGSRFSVGDRLKVAFYERVDVEEDKWGGASSASALRGILQRPELSGEYLVQDDGAISVPLLGSIPVANRSTQQVQADLVEAFDQLLGRKGLVNILSLERSPIYVLGPVKNPGSFKYASGMTILHAIALAGGLDRAESEPWQKIEAVRETQKRSGTIDAMLKLLARVAVLEAEREGTAPKIPRQLLELASATEVANLVNEQSDRRKPIATARKDRERANLRALEAAKQEVVAYGHMESLDELVKLRQERVNSMRPLVGRKILSMTMMDQVQSELSDAQQRRQDALSRYAMAKQRLASLESEALEIRADLRNDLEVEIETTESQIAANVRELNTSEGVLYTLGVTGAQFAKDTNSVTYQIVRQSAAGPVSIECVGMTLLQPGDLVNIFVGQSEPREPAGSPVARLSPARETLPDGCTANDVEPARAVAEQRSGPN